jgi:hypothetical protein
MAVAAPSIAASGERIEARDDPASGGIATRAEYDPSLGR